VPTAALTDDTVNSALTGFTTFAHSLPSFCLPGMYPLLYFQPALKYVTTEHLERLTIWRKCGLTRISPLPAPSAHPGEFIFPFVKSPRLLSAEDAGIFPLVET
jgi:hypothetical protein